METVSLDAGKPKRLTWGFWATLGFVFAIIFMSYGVQTFIAIVFAIVSEILHLHLSLKSMPSFSLFVAVATCVGAVVATASALGLAKARTGISIKEYFRFYNVEKQEYLKWLLAVAVLVLCGDTLSFLLGKPIAPKSMQHIYATAQIKPLLWFALLVAAPLNEEIVFRGFVFKGLENSRVGAIGAIFIAAIIWAGLHFQYDAYGVGQVFIGGLLLGAARLKSNSIYVPITMHALVNLIATIEVLIIYKA